MKILFKEIENEYRKHINEKEVLETEEFVDLVIKLFKEIQIMGVTYENSSDDMLLFQYGN